MKFEKNFSVAFFKKRPAIWGMIESIIITLLCLLGMLWLRPDDPFALTGPFPWLLLAPVFCGLMYGTVNGCISLAFLLLYMLFAQDTGAADNSLLREYVVGMACVTLLAGIFSSYWLARVRHVEYLNRYVREHLDDLSRNYYLLRISHERLEHAYITKPLSFRDAFLQIREEVRKNHSEMNESSSTHLLNIFSQYCSINRAAFCLSAPEIKGFKPLAFLGKSFSIESEDVLIKSALQNLTSTYSAINTLEASVESAYIAVIPLLNAEREVLGIIIIKDMPFWSLTHDNLEVLSVFAATFALQYSTLQKTKQLQKKYPECPPDFLQEFSTLVSLKKDNKVESGLSGLLVPAGFYQQNIVYSLEQQKRALDSIWIISLGTSKLFLTLMPLTGIEGMFGYRKRLSEWLKSEFGQEINHNGLDFRYHQLNAQSTDEQLDQFIRELSHADI